MKTNRIKLLVTAIFLCLLLSLCVIASAGVSVGFDKQPLADEILVYGSVNALDDLAAAAYTNELKALDQTVITAEDLLNKVKAGDQFAVAFAGKLGLGMNPAEIESNLQKMVDEYQSHKAKGEDFTEPRFIINGVNIVLNKNIEQIRLTRNADGTYSASLNGDQAGYRGSIMIDADASITIMYDENGEAKIERRVSNGKPTDFVITLDVSGSMESNGRDHAMLSALKTVLEEILQEEKNTVSIVFWAKNGAVMQLNVDGEGVQQVFSGADGMTVQKLFDAELVNRYNDITSYSLSDATISQIENLYNLGSITEPDNGLFKAIDLLENIEQSEERNTGVMLFTDGTVVPSGRSAEKVERNTVALEKQIAEDYGATLVNVSIGDEYEVKSYGRYLNPLSDTYYDQDQILKDNVLYYNIPKLTNQELADKVSEMFEVAFIDITTETKELRTETITDGVLAAYGAQLIEKIPAGFELVEIKGETTGYEVRGTDENGNTMISFNLGEIVSGRDQVLSYCVIPTDTDHDIGVTAFTDSTDTVLYARPVNRLTYLEEEQIIAIRLNENNTNQYVPQRPDLDGLYQPFENSNTTIVQQNNQNIETVVKTDGNTGTEEETIEFQYKKAIRIPNSDLGIPEITYYSHGHSTSDKEAEDIVNHIVDEGEINTYYPSSGGLTINFKSENCNKYHVKAYITSTKPQFDGSVQSLNVRKHLYDDDFIEPTVDFAVEDLKLGGYLIIDVDSFDTHGNAIKKSTVIELKNSQYKLDGLGTIDFKPGEFFTVDHQSHATDYKRANSSYAARGSYDYWHGNYFECWGFALHVQDVLSAENNLQVFKMNYVDDRNMLARIDHVERNDKRPLYKEYAKSNNQAAEYGKALQEWKLRNNNAEREANVKSAIISAGVGAHIRTNGHVTSSSDNAHSYIITSISEEGVGIIQANGSWGKGEYERNKITEAFWKWSDWFEGQATTQDFYFDRGVAYTQPMAMNEKEFRVNAIINLIRYDGKTAEEAISWLNSYTQYDDWEEYRDLAIMKLGAS